ncbi:hypothetical protein VNI00_012826 [Paramarasmius palmivorus]|uniref:Uncharacterized protein n=1 Tax=Paramarasmius palmivorus TaxID=297713 RepID=A0AAW0C3R1_9AGAR
MVLILRDSAGPLEDAHYAWECFLVGNKPESWPPKDDSQFSPVPTKSLNEVLTITPKDGQIWEDWVVVAPIWGEDWVSPPAICDSYGGIEIDGTEDWNIRDENFLRIHRICLSFLCRRLSITPREFWDFLYAPDSLYFLNCHCPGEQLLPYFQYHDMDGRNEQYFGYAVRKWERGTWFYDSESMDQTSWILARPNLLPAPDPLPPSSASLSCQSSVRLFDIPELFDAILDSIVFVSTETIAAELVEDRHNFDSPSAILAARALLSLAQVDRWFYHAIVQKRQGLFLRAAHNFGWMLPCMPADWDEWPRELSPIKFDLFQQYDWRAYLLAFLRKDNAHVRNRWRFQMMTSTFSRGITAVSLDRSRVIWHWRIGELGVKTSLEAPQSEAWELGPFGEDG